MEFLDAKTILSRNQNPDGWYGADYNMNLYRGCPHGCIYCDNRYDVYHVNNFDVVKSKKNVLELLRKELKSKRSRGVVGIGAMSDTYNPMEKKYLITRGALKLLLRYGYGVSIDTKSNLILRDIDLLEKINEINDVIIKISITTPYDNLSKLIEPNVCSPSSRFNVVHKLSDVGIFAGVMMLPVLPFITDSVSSIRDMVKLSYENGARFIYTMMAVSLRSNQKKYYYEKLDESFPGLRSKYEQLDNYNYRYASSNERELWSVFKEECDKYGLLYDMDDIIKAYKKENRKDVQTTLF